MILSSTELVQQLPTQDMVIFPGLHSDQLRIGWDLWSPAALHLQQIRPVANVDMSKCVYLYYVWVIYIYVPETVCV